VERKRRPSRAGVPVNGVSLGNGRVVGRRGSCFTRDVTALYVSDQRKQRNEQRDQAMEKYRLDPGRKKRRRRNLGLDRGTCGRAVKRKKGPNYVFHKAKFAHEKDGLPRNQALRNSAREGELSVT